MKDIRDCHAKKEIRKNYNKRIDKSPLMLKDYSHIKQKMMKTLETSHALTWNNRCDLETNVNNNSRCSSCCIQS